MAKGTDSGNHPSRKVDRDGWGAFSAIRHGDQFGPSGVVTARSFSSEGHDLETVQHRPGSTSAGLGYIRSDDQHGIESEHYKAGPFRTQQRAEIAGRSLANRVDSGGGGDYMVDRTVRTPDDLRNE